MMTTVICLSGGLGNQIFQVAAANVCSEGSQILIEADSHSPEKNKNGAPAIMDFNFTNINHLKILSECPKIIGRIISLNLRLNLSQSRTLKSKILISITGALAQSYFSLKLHANFKLYSPQKIGDLPDSPYPKNILLNGYFQSSEILGQLGVSENFKLMTLKSTSKELVTWIDRAKIENPLIVHFRIGDYKNHPGMGVLDIDYFVSAINAAINKSENYKIWLFSDEPQVASMHLKEAGIKDLVSIPSMNASDTLELMRYGSGYVISNSTFSWWAAVLRYNQSAPVWAPTPWFRFQESPSSIYMTDWQLIPAWAGSNTINSLEDK